MHFWEEYDLAFHYTTQPGLMGILQSQTLYATHFACLNDSNEMVQIKPRMLQIANSITHKMYSDVADADEAKRSKMNEEGGVDKLAAHDANAIVDVIYKITLGETGGTTFFQPFITSFCAHKDPYERQNGTLSQWRGYGKESGYAIVFDVRGLVELLALEAKKFSYDRGYFTDVVYDDNDDKFTKEFGDLIAAMREDVPRILTGVGSNYTALNGAFPKSIARYKHRGFAEEKEIRIVAPPTHHTLLSDMVRAGKADKRPKKDVKFRGQMTPYIELFEGLKKTPPINTIIVGPHADKELRARRLRKFLDYSGINIEVRCSEIPFVGL